MEKEVGPLTDLCEPGLPPFLQVQSNHTSEPDFKTLDVTGTGFDQSTNSTAAADWLGSSRCSMSLRSSLWAHDRSLPVAARGSVVATNGPANAASLKQGCLILRHIWFKSPPKTIPGACQSSLVPSSMNQSVVPNVLFPALPVFNGDRDVNCWLTQFLKNNVLLQYDHRLWYD